MTGIIFSLGLMGWLVSLPISGQAAVNPLSTAINGDRLQGVQALELNLANTAAYLERSDQLYVVDVNQQIMPMRIERPVQKTAPLDYALQLYRWPAQAVFNNADSLNQLQLQLKQGEQQAVLTWPNQPALTLNQNGRDRSWLLASPQLPQDIQPHYLNLSWVGQNISSQVQVEGSDNLVDWQLAGQGQILQTQSATGQPLLQQHIEISQPYRYWRVYFDQSIELQQASLQTQSQSLPVWQQQALHFKRVANNLPQWQLNLPYAIAIQKMQWNVPAGQLWQVEVQAKKNQQGREVWQTLAQSELYQGSTAQNTQQGVPQASQIDFGRPATASQWQLVVDAPSPATQLDVEVFAPKVILYFLAQGTAPYRLVVDPQSNRKAPRLPRQLTAAGTVHLDETSIEPRPVSVRQYGLWAGLVILVGILAVAAWRLFHGLQQTPPEHRP